LGDSGGYLLVIPDKPVRGSHFELFPGISDNRSIRLGLEKNQNMHVKSRAKLIFRGSLLFFLAFLLHCENLFAAESVQSGAGSRMWHLLLHYKAVAGGYRSEIEDTGFFLSADGRSDPVAEYEASKSLFLTARDISAINRFPLRYRFVCESENVSPDESLFSEQTLRIEHLAKQVRTAYLVFAADYKSKPESMFGHTFLRLDTGEADYLSVSVGYAADAGDAGPVEFFVKGVGGGFKGRYALQPYFYKIRDYNYRDGRDLWEYRLNLDSAEIRRILEHIYELENGGEKYYFFSSNCSYALMYLLDLARPQSGILEADPPWVIPLETVKNADRCGFIESSSYRPSSSAVVEGWASRLSPRQIDAGVRISENPAGAAALADSGEFSVEERSQILDFAMEYMLCREYPRSATPQELRAVDERAVAIARVRSRVPAVSLPVKPAGEDPLLSHRSLRAQLGGGYEYGRSYALISARIAYHDAEDPLFGFAPASELVAPSASMKVYDPAGKRKPSLEEITLVRIASVNRINRLQAPLSWRLSTGVWRDPPVDAGLGFALSGGAGIAFGSRDFVMYSLPGAALKIDDDLTIPLSFDTGFVFRINKSARISFGVLPAYYPREKVFICPATGGFLIPFGSSFALSADVSREMVREESSLSVKLSTYF